MADTPENGASIRLHLEQHSKSLDDHEARIRFLERWASEHGAWDREHHKSIRDIADRMERVLEQTRTEIEDMAQEQGRVWVELGKMKVRMGMIVAIAGGIGGLISAIVTAVVVKALAG